MKFGREKRLWLGTLALLAPIPLTFNQVLEWPILFLYALFVIYFLQRAEQGSWMTLGNWALNLLGLVYMPIFYLDINNAFQRGNSVTALLHLIMFLLVVKLFSIRREKDKWHLVVAIYFLFVGAMATSSHVSIVPYLAAFLILSLLLLGRFAHLHMMAGVVENRSAAPRLPFRAPLTFGTLLILLIAVPLFATMPRIREPYILGRGSGTSGIARTTGFSDSVDLSLTTSVRGNRNIALRVQYEDEVLMGDPGNLRFKGATYDVYRNRNWFRTLRKAEALVPTAITVDARFFQLGSEESVVNRASFFLEPINSYSVILPVEALSIRLSEQTGMGIDPGGAVLMPARPRETLKYEVELAAKPVIHAQLDDTPGSELTALDLSGLTPNMIELAEQVMGEGTAREKIDRLEQHLLTQYAYTLDFLGRTGESPLEDFLFVYKSGHCEFFASAMVLMLRSQDIPARFVTGFLGAELNPLEDYFAVRQQNAHAWVEAYTENGGWQIYDPTPPDGRPTIEPQSLSLLLSQVYDYVTFRWDRYVLTFGAEDQDSLFRRMRDRLRELWGKIRDLGKEEDPADPATSFPDDLALAENAPSLQTWQPQTPLTLLLGLLVAAVAVLLTWNRRRPLSGEAAYLLLRRRLDQAGLEVSDTLAPLELQQQATSRFPAAAASTRQVIELYVRESFAEHPLASGERKGLRDSLKSLDAALREQAKQERREKRGKRPRRPVPASV